MESIKGDIRLGFFFAEDVTLKAGFALSVSLGNEGHTGTAKASNGA
ncbi:MAG: hypothetical protein JRJ51_10945 [Deltaproteobacteria bacterium]|nr:hypothetical protein [Deltaproteobacteria bacterium]